MIDLRSDTVTKPSAEMLEVMMNASVGDDVFGEDPTVNELEKYAANLFGKEAALYCSSGTQTNQIAINVHVQPGGEVICHKESHVYKYEGGGIAKNSGASVRLLDGNRGRISSEDVKNWINPENDVHFPLTQLVSIEDTANRGGGAIYNFEEIKKLRELCNQLNIPVHLDGARIFNALIENGIDYKTYGSQFDSISICLSKGLGAPIGSILLGDKDFIKKAHRVRKAFGGGMRQAGIIAGGGLYALKNNISRLKEDHNNAKNLEKTLSSCDWVESVIPVETNIVVTILKDSNKRDEVIEKLKAKNILTMPFGPGMIRMVTHLDVSENNIDQVCEALKYLF
ncbi:MAG: low-specificity L-threonine aldolase [Bacteroidetes bacterium]|nr:low-specificity L-threonine aldolase [Bacteroidota bacterium]